MEPKRELTCSLPGPGASASGDPAARTADLRTADLRAARVADELRALGDFRVWLRPEALVSVLLSRVVTRIGTRRQIDVGVIEALAPADREALAEAYLRLERTLEGGLA